METLTFDYGQRHKAEIEIAQQIAHEQGVGFTRVDLNLLNNLTVNSLTRDLPITQSDGGTPTTFVDGRNLLFLSIAAIVAKQKGISDVVTGVCQTDFSGYPDCRDVFIKSLNVTLNLAMGAEFDIHTPLMWLTKAQTWGLADRMGVLDYVRERTLTCYNGTVGVGCGSCPACELRARGLREYLTQGVA